MAGHQNERRKKSKTVFRTVDLKLVGFIFTILFLTFHFVPGIIQARQETINKQDLFSVSFPTDQQGWACGRWGTVLHTGDGGKTWVHQKSDTDYTLSSICFTDPKTGWAVGEEGAIIHTKDGGETWEKQTCPIGYFLMDVYFVTDQKGWIVTEWTTILHTVDGGETWEIQFKGEDYILKSVSFCDSLNGWAAGEYGYIYHTADGGLNWEHQAGSFAFSEEAFELVGENTLFDVHAVDPKTAWAVGIDGYVSRTLDGGATWEKVVTGLQLTQLFGVCSDVLGRTIVTGGNSNLIITPDSGDHFSIPNVSPPVTYGWIYGVAPRGSKGFVAVGKEGWIYLGDDKGLNWQRSEVGNAGQ